MDSFVIKRALRILTVVFWSTEIAKMDWMWQ